MSAATALLLNQATIKSRGLVSGVTGDPGGLPPGRDPLIIAAVLIVLAMATPFAVCIMADLINVVR